ncbi:hypothetical protein IQ06DRAFT_380018 [Phaeosphaeriaceae sp. SRC1lsM3a]|nr:hypothetical protein IQ06DRAFT_380018 [Stagonospora sp. SRC1lsM3a]
MVRLQVKKRYHNRRGLLAFLQATFPGCRNFRINEVKDGYYTFEAPRDLTEDEWLEAQNQSTMSAS